MRSIEGTTNGWLGSSHHPPRRRAHWLNPAEISHLAERTALYAHGRMTEAQFHARPGIAPAWVTVLAWPAWASSPWPGQTWPPSSTSRPDRRPALTGPPLAGPRPSPDSPGAPAQVRAWIRALAAPTCLAANSIACTRSGRTDGRNVHVAVATGPDGVTIHVHDLDIGDGRVPAR